MADKRTDPLLNEERARESNVRRALRLAWAGIAAFLIISVPVGLLQDASSIGYWPSIALEFPCFLLGAWVATSISRDWPITAVLIALALTFGIPVLVTGKMTAFHDNGVGSESIAYGYGAATVAFAFWLRQIQRNENARDAASKTDPRPSVQ